MCSENNSSTNNISKGVKAWGFVTILLAFLSLALVVCAGFHIEQVMCGESVCYMFVNLSEQSNLPGLYYSVKENGSLIAGVLGFSGLAWAHFFQALYK